ncbi:hypothetical protein B0J13DRAFT_534580 [Dactylonectria estremocensis]|uniref:Uncharacterized protein n=1 Tax=Dactylonectria estremocensis TaxID=1079267 RepID=A0A9P9D0C7_9HYPO|nr:hypothetical protein B0J13DRAFT_534580 [Dactylonectria estremocensis]
MMLSGQLENDASNDSPAYNNRNDEDDTGESPPELHLACDTALTKLPIIDVNGDGSWTEVELEESKNEEFGDLEKPQGRRKRRSQQPLNDRPKRARQVTPGTNPEATSEFNLKSISLQNQKGRKKQEIHWSTRGRCWLDQATSAVYCLSRFSQEFIPILALPPLRLMTAHGGLQPFMFLQSLPGQGSTTPSTPPSPSILSKDETLQNPIQAQEEGISGQSGLGPMAMDLSQHASSTQEPEVCSSGKQPVDDMSGGRDRYGGDVESCSTGLGGSRAQAPRRRARGLYMLHSDYYESDDGDGDGDNNDNNDKRGQQSLELDGADRSRRCSGSVPIEALLNDAKYRPAQSTEDSERDHDSDEDEDENEAYGKRRCKRRHSHEPLASIKRRHYRHTTRQRPTNTTRSVPSDQTPAPHILSPSSSYTISDNSNIRHNFAIFQERRKVSRSSAGLLRDAAVSVKRPRQRRPSLRSRSTQLTYRGKNTQARGILS